MEVYKSYGSQSAVMVAIQVKLQKRPGHRGKYDTYVVTLPKPILDAAPNFKKAELVEVDVNSKGQIVVTAVKD